MDKFAHLRPNAEPQLQLDMAVCDALNAEPALYEGTTRTLEGLNATVQIRTKRGDVVVFRLVESEEPGVTVEALACDRNEVYRSFKTTVPFEDIRVAMKMAVNEALTTFFPPMLLS